MLNDGKVRMVLNMPMRQMRGSCLCLLGKVFTCAGATALLIITQCVKMQGLHHYGNLAVVSSSFVADKYLSPALSKGVYSR